jgi:hypothetical protein
MEMGSDQIERRTPLRDPHLLLDFTQSRMAESTDLSRKFGREENGLEPDMVQLVWLVFVVCMLLTLLHLGDGLDVVVDHQPWQRALDPFGMTIPPQDK